MGRLNVESYDRKYRDRVQIYEAECQRIIKRQRDKIKKLTDGNTLKKTFEDVSEALK